MHPALRKGPLFTKKHPLFFTFLQPPHFPHFYKKHPPLSFPAYGPVVELQLFTNTVFADYSASTA